jgi:hypothetical protein
MLIVDTAHGKGTAPAAMAQLLHDAQRTQPPLAKEASGKHCFLEVAPEAVRQLHKEHPGRRVLEENGRSVAAAVPGSAFKFARLQYYDGTRDAEQPASSGQPSNSEAAVAHGMAWHPDYTTAASARSATAALTCAHALTMLRYSSTKWSALHRAGPVGPALDFRSGRTSGHLMNALQCMACCLVMSSVDH